MNRDRTHLFQGLERELRMADGHSKCAAALENCELELRPYVEHPESLRRILGTGALRYEAFFLKVKRSAHWVSETVKCFLAESRAARSRNRSLCLQTWAQWMQSSDRAITNVAAVALLERDKDGLDPHLFVKSCMREAADILEGSLQPFAKLRLKMCELSGPPTTSKSVEALSFGETIDKLTAVCGNGTIYKPTPFGIPISQWRNIANHNDYQTSGAVVHCSYGPHSNRKSFQCSPDDILQIACYVNDLCYAHKVAFEIFSIDNMQELSPWAPNTAVSDYTKDTALAFGLTSYGFSVRLACQKGQEWRLILVDELNRTRAAAKSALQQASISYALLNDSAHIEATVHSSDATHRIGFKTTLQKADDPLPKGFRGNIGRLDENFLPVQ